MPFSRNQIYIIAALMAISGYLQYTSDFPPAKTIGTVLLIISVLLVIFAGKISQPSQTTTNSNTRNKWGDEVKELSRAEIAERELIKMREQK